jgi:ABC-type Fe3+ transport system permease subunit
LNDDAASMIDAIIGIAIGLIVLVAVFSLAPVIGFNIDASTTIPAGSQWNSTTNPDMTTGNELWTQNSTLLILALMVSILGLVIFSIMRIRDGSTGGQ